MAGLPITQLPMSPEQNIQQEIQSGRQRIQDKYTLQWQTVNRNARTLGRTKQQAMLQQIDASAKAEMLEFNQQAEQQMGQLQMIDRISAAGGFTPGKADELKATAVYGRDVAGAMYPQEEKEKSIPAQFAELHYHRQRLQARHDYFKVEKAPKVPKFTLALGPAVAGISVARYAAKARKFKKGPAIQIWDDSVPGEEGYRDATEVERMEYMLLDRELKRTKKLESELLGQPDVKQRVIQPGTEGGTFGDKVSASYKKPTTAQQPVSNDPLGLFR